MGSFGLEGSFEFAIFIIFQDRGASKEIELDDDSSTNFIADRQNHVTSKVSKSLDMWPNSQ